jgi:hypothetical protein
MDQIIKIPDVDYFASQGLSNSYLINFDKSPLLAETGIKQTPSMELGSAIHSYILENKLSNDFEKSKGMFEEIKQKIFKYELSEGLTFENVLEKSQTEISLFWDELINNEPVQRKTKIDVLAEFENNIITIDLKSTRDIFDFAYSIRKYKYHRQAATHIDGITALINKPVIFIFLAFEMKAPFYIKAYSISEDYIQNGRVANLKSIMNYKEWSKNPIFEISGIENLNIF